MRNSTNETIKQTHYTTTCQNPFSSQIVYIEDVFGTIDSKKEVFCVVSLPIGSIFPRMVCGNYHKKEQFLEVTHSFPVVEINDYITKPPKDDCIHSLIVCLQPENVRLSTVSFPTNIHAKLQRH